MKTAMPFVSQETDFMQELDKTIAKVERFVGLLQQVKELSQSDLGLADAEVYLTAKDIAEQFGCDIKSARKYMDRADFPVIECGTKKVNRLAFLEYNMHRQVKED